jgi:hypothetical protein
VHVADEDAQVGVVLDQDRTEPALEQITVPPMTQVERPRVAAVQPAHHVGQRPHPGSQHEVHVIRHESPGQAAPLAFVQLPSQTGDEVTTVDVIAKDRAAFDPTQEDVVADPSAIPASHPCHTRYRGPGW